MGIRRGDRSGYWRKMIAAQAKSGLPISKFCKREGLTEGSFYQWRKKLASAVAADAARMSPPTTMPATRFVPIELEPPVAASFEVSFPNGCRLAVPSQFEETTLRRLVRLIGEAIEC
jgi:hypothetical protein